MNPYIPKTTQVVLVDARDNPIGLMDKTQVHRLGLLHRAVSVFIFNPQGEWLLQRRMAFKYHSGGLWSNACCTHPYPGESPREAAQRRLKEEMGLHCPLKEVFCFTYKAHVGKNLTEYEYDHVFTGYCSQIPQVDSSEVWDWKFLPLPLILQDEQAHPEKYTVWFRKIYKSIGQYQ